MRSGKGVLLSTLGARAKFTPEFKAEAVAMVEAAGGNIAQVAKELGLHDSSLGYLAALRTVARDSLICCAVGKRSLR